MIPVNQFQTPITDELLESLNKETREDFLDLINNVEFIKRLISPDRKRAKDLERDEQGRIIVDLVNPHILEDMDYFRQTALYYQEHGVYTHLRPNSNPNSEFAKWIKEEVRRIWHGYVRPSDGEWIPGDLYFYLNYSPIIQSKYKKGQKKATRIVDLPKMWEGIYLRFHYWEQARNGGKYNNWEGGEHCAEIAKRGSSKSYSMASALTKYFLHGEDEDSNREIRSVITAYQKEFLTKDGTLNKFISMIDFNAEHTEFPSKRLKQSMQEMHWRLGYIDMNTGTSKGLLNEVIGVSSKDDTDKLRGKRATKIFIEEFGNFPNIGEIHRVLLPSVEDGSVVFGQLVYCGTGGSEGADFAGAMEMMYSPKGYRIYSLPNVYDKNAQGKQNSIFFFGAYLNREGFYDHNGVSDVVGALIDILHMRYVVKYNTSDPNALTKTKAENPCTLQEAIMKRDGSIYPVADLTDVDNNLTVNPSILDSVFTCTFEMDKSGEIVPKPEYDSKPIRSFPHQDNKLQGCCEIFQHPEIDKRTGKPYSYRYIAGNDPYDDDSSTTVSLGSMFILDMWTDRIVFEYTGRPPFAADFYEICRRALLFYNARMNYEAHPYDQIVRLPDGTAKLWGDIKIGDELFGPNGNTVKVIDIPMDGEDNIYNITFSDGRTVKASSGHIWNVYTLNNRNAVKEITTKEMFEYGVINKFNQTKFYIPRHNAVEYPHKDVDIDPYTLGMLLAEGSLTKFKKDKHQNNKRNTVQISSCSDDAVYYKNHIPYEMKYLGTKGYSYHLYIEDIDIKLSKLGLLHTNSRTKFIPSEYLNNDYNTRLELLMGLMDGDGHANPKGGSIYVTVSKQLAEDIMLLIRSLGIYCKLEKSDNSFRIRIAATIPIFKLPRKVKNQYVYSPDKSGSKAKGFLNKVGVRSIEYVGVEKCKCVTVDSTDGLYLIGDYVTTHNCNKKGLFAHFSRYNSLYLLTDTLEFLKDKDLIRGETISNKSKGTTATDPVKKYGRMLIRNWLMQPKTRVEIVDGQEIEVTYPALQDLKQKALIKELCLYNTDGNFDRHDALVMLMLLREDRLRLCGDNTAEGAANKVDKNYLGQDDFFNKNYKTKTTSSTNMGM